MLTRSILIPSLLIGLASGVQAQELITKHQPLSGFVAGKAEPITAFYTATDGSRARVSHMVGSTWRGNLSRCTGTWLGPNTMMTALHCGGIRHGNRIAFQLEVYRDRSLDDVGRGYFYNCDREVVSGSASAMDFVLFNCQPQQDDPLPGGVRFGFADYGRVGVSRGDAVYSVWRDVVSSLPRTTGSVHIYSEGAVLEDRYLPANPGPNFLGCARDPSTGVHPTGRAVVTDTLTDPGSSGSAQFRLSDDMLVIGPTGTGSNNGLRRTSVSMAAALGFNLARGDEVILETNVRADDPLPERRPIRFAWVERGAPREAVANCHHPLDLVNPSRPDTDRNGLFDAHEDNDAVELPRSVLFVNFENPLRRSQWLGVPNKTSSVNDPPLFRTDLVRPNFPGVTPPPAVRDLARHRARWVANLTDDTAVRRLRAPLEAGTYRVSLRAFYALAKDPGVQIPDEPSEIVARCDGRAQPIRSRFAAPSQEVRASWFFLDTVIDVPCDQPTIELWSPVVNADSPGLFVDFMSLAKLTRLTPSAPNRISLDFATIDQRDMWVSNQSAHALFTGDGQMGSTRADLFGLNVEGESKAILAGIPLRGDRRYSISYSAKMLTRGSRAGDLIVSAGSAKEEEQVGDDFVRRVFLLEPDPMFAHRLLTFDNPASAPGTVYVIDNIDIVELTAGGL